MGTEPKIALNILCVPSCLPDSNIAEILAGGAKKVQEANAIIGGGHSVEDSEPKYGLSVTAWTHPNEIWSNAKAKAGDILILTKPIGNGIIATARKKDMITDNDFSQAIEYMAQLNKNAYIAGKTVKIHACTDITGFGFMGHTYEMAKASGVTIVIDKKSLPVLDFAYELAKKGAVPGGTLRNEEYIKHEISFTGTDIDKSILFDPQTSGGLLFSMDKDHVNTFLQTAKNAAIVGEVKEYKDFYIIVK